MVRHDDLRLDVPATLLPPLNLNINIRYQDSRSSDWRKWTKEGYSFLPFCPLQLSWQLTGRLVTAQRYYLRLAGTGNSLTASELWSRSRASDYPIYVRAPQRLRSPAPSFVTKKLSTGANGQEEDAASFFFE